MHAEACLTNVRCHFCEQVVGGLGEGNTRGVQIPAVNLLNLMLSTTEVLPTVFAGLQVCRSPFNKLHRLNAWKMRSLHHLSSAHLVWDSHLVLAAFNNLDNPGFLQKLHYRITVLVC